MFYRKVKCQYCNDVAVIVKGSELYEKNHKLCNKEFYACIKCEAWVGMHEHSKKPFGSLAKSELRQKRLMAHKGFDAIWRKISERHGLSVSKARKVAYQWLAVEMNKSINECHIGMFNIAECKHVFNITIDIEDVSFIVNKYLNNTIVKN